MDNNALSKLTTGMYVVSSAYEDKKTAIIVNTLVQVSSEPTILTLSIFNKNLTNELIKGSKKFNLSVLSTEATLDFIRPLGYKSGRDEDKLANVKVKVGDNGVPVVMDYACAYFECEVINEVPVNDCTVYFAKLTNSVFVDGKTPMTGEYYQKALDGVLPPSSPAWAARYVKE